jgi:hypothetical protein
MASAKSILILYCASFAFGTGLSRWASYLLIKIHDPENAAPSAFLIGPNAYSNELISIMILSFITTYALAYHRQMPFEFPIFVLFILGFSSIAMTAAFCADRGFAAPMITIAALSGEFLAGLALVALSSLGGSARR